MLCNYRGLASGTHCFFLCLSFFRLKCLHTSLCKNTVALTRAVQLLGNVIYVDPGGCCISVISFERIGLISLRSDQPFLYLGRDLKLCGFCKQTWIFISRKSEDAASYNLPFVESTMCICMCANAQRVYMCTCTLSALVSKLQWQHWASRVILSTPRRNSWFPEKSFQPQCSSRGSSSY